MLKNYTSENMEILVGYTGFVGSNLHANHSFDLVFNSKNICEAFGLEPDLLVFAGIRAEKYLANTDPDNDLKNIHEAINNIKQINPKKIVLISTIDVYDNPINVDESSLIEESKVNAYGRNRLVLENWVISTFTDYLIVRLPALFGLNLKKNFIYDFLHPVPSLLNDRKYNELKSKSKVIEESYKNARNNFYMLSEEADRVNLESELKRVGFSPLCFTDSRSIFQFYHLIYLWEHIEIALENKIPILNIAVEPITIHELLQFVSYGEFTNEVSDNYPIYNFKTKYDNIFNGKSGYIFDKLFVLSEIKAFLGDQL